MLRHIRPLSRTLAFIYLLDICSRACRCEPPDHDRLDHIALDAPMYSGVGVDREEIITAALRWSFFGEVDPEDAQPRFPNAGVPGAELSLQRTGAARAA